MATAQERYTLAVLAVGTSAAPERSVFGLTDADISPGTDRTVSLATTSVMESQSLTMAHTESIGSVDSEDDFVTDSTNQRIEGARAIVQGFSEHNEQFITDPNKMPALESMDRAMQKMTNQNTLISAITMFGKEGVGLAGGKSSRRIRVQPTGIARRSAGKPRGASALAKGRPLKRKDARQCQSAVKRPSSLAHNVELNRANAKSHGTGH